MSYENHFRNKPNIIVIMADDMGYGDIGFFGNEYIKTPNLDRMAQEGVSLMEHYTASPMCAPARAAFLTGKYPHRTGAIDVCTCRGLDRIDKDEVLISNLLKGMGYSTALIGKWHNGRGEQYHPNNRGFDQFIGFRSGSMDYWRWTLEYNGRYQKADGRYLTDVLTQEAENFIKQKAEQPFFLYLAYNAPHMPLQAYKTEVGEFMSLGKFNTAVSTIYAMIKRMDEGIGRILQVLKDCDIDDNTLVLFTSDNGPCFRGKGDDCQKRYNCSLNGSKGDVLEGGIKVPAIVKWPKVLPEGKSCSIEVHFTDWLPTLVAAAGGNVPDELEIDGNNILEVLKGNSFRRLFKKYWQWNRYSLVPHCNAAMRKGKWKIYYPAIKEAIEYNKADAQISRQIQTRPDLDYQLVKEPVIRKLSSEKYPMLFNLHEDPYEQRNLADQYPQITIQMVKQLDCWFKQMTMEWERKGEKTLGDLYKLYRFEKK